MASRKDYYSNGKRAMLDGAPIWRPVWFNELGNDAEFIEATKPRTAFKTAYYDGGHRMTIDGIPVRVAAGVKNWSPWMKRAIGCGAPSKKETKAIEAQMEILWPAYGREQALKRSAGMTCCLNCRKDYYTYNAESECWHCKSEARELRKAA